MTPQEIVWFINHKYGEQAYIVDDGKEIRIFTAKAFGVFLKQTILNSMVIICIIQITKVELGFIIRVIINPVM